MRKTASALAVALAAALSSAAGVRAASAPPALTPPPVEQQAPHVMVIVEENRNEADVIGSPDAPYINTLASRYGQATASYAQSHPSLPNYLELLSGSTQGVKDDGTGYVFAGPSLVGELAQQGITWRAYMEGMPSPCYAGAATGRYAKKHDPFMYFTSITRNPAQCANVVPYDRLSADLGAASAPDFMWVTPDLCDDGHDCSTATADSWLSTNLPMVLDSPWFSNNGVVIITWDEGTGGAGCCNGAAGGHVATIVVASRVTQPLAMSDPVDHAGTLRTIEQLYGVQPLGDSACACSGSLTALAQSPTPAPAPALTWLTVPHFR